MIVPVALSGQVFRLRRCFTATFRLAIGLLLIFFGEAFRLATLRLLDFRKLRTLAILLFMAVELVAFRFRLRVSVRSRLGGFTRNGSVAIDASFSNNGPEVWAVAPSLTDGCFVNPFRDSQTPSTTFYPSCF
jgi:hypothetical protein